MPELESSQYLFPYWGILEKRKDLFRDKENIIFDLCILAWLQELRNQHNLATCWPKVENKKTERGEDKSPVPDPPQAEIFLVLEHQNHQ